MYKENTRYIKLHYRHQKDEYRRLNHCRLCFQERTKHVTFFQYVRGNQTLCGDCLRQLEIVNLRLYKEGLCIHTVYLYNDFIENMLFQFKEGRDIALAPVFMQFLHKQLSDKFRHYTLVFMPSSKEKMIERRFLPIQEMLKGCSLPYIEPFYKVKNHKQSQQHFDERKNITQVIKKKENYALPNTKLLLIDDVCTSGSTLLHAYHLLQHHTYKIEALTLCVHPLFVESCDKKGLRKKGKFSIL